MPDLFKTNRTSNNTRCSGSGVFSKSLWCINPDHWAGELLWRSVNQIDSLSFERIHVGRSLFIPECHRVRCVVLRWAKVDLYRRRASNSVIIVIENLFRIDQDGFHFRTSLRLRCSHLDGRRNRRNCESHPSLVIHVNVLSVFSGLFQILAFMLSICRSENIIMWLQACYTYSGFYILCKRRRTGHVDDIPKTQVSPFSPPHQVPLNIAFSTIYGQMNISKLLIIICCNACGLSQLIPKWYTQLTQIPCIFIVCLLSHLSL